MFDEVHRIQVNRSVLMMLMAMGVGVVPLNSMLKRVISRDINLIISEFAMNEKVKFYLSM